MLVLSKSYRVTLMVVKKLLLNQNYCLDVI